MKLCFYNLNHIGDVYFSSFFIKLICNLNTEINFYYYFIIGDTFFENINNIQRISQPIESNYRETLNNGSPPEDMVNNEIIKILLENSMQRTGSKIIQYKGENILFINTWCVSNYLNHHDFDIVSAVSSYRNLIETINKEYNLNIIYCSEKLSSLYNNITINEKIIEKYENIELNDTIFVFNYVPRSVNFNMVNLNNYISKLSENNKIILSCYNNILETNQNIKFIDRDYDIIQTPNCNNLVELWEIAVKCNKIIMLPTGSSWTFLHKLDKINENQLYIFDGREYIQRLNTIIQYFVGKTNLIQSI